MPDPTCPGSCCAVFWLPRDVPDTVADAAFIRDMRIELTPEQAAERWEKFIGPLPPKPMNPSVTVNTTGRATYTCRHWDEETRLCGVYDQRPMLCRDYPYGRGCSHGCSYQVSEAIGARYGKKTDG